MTCQPNFEKTFCKINFQASMAWQHKFLLSRNKCGQREKRDRLYLPLSFSFSRVFAGFSRELLKPQYPILEESLLAMLHKDLDKQVVPPSPTRHVYKYPLYTTPKVERTAREYWIPILGSTKNMPCHSTLLPRSALLPRKRTYLIDYLQREDFPFK